VCEVLKFKFDEGASISKLRRIIRVEIARLEGRAEGKSYDRLWPQPVSPSVKEKVIRNFRKSTSLHAIKKFICACCAESCLFSEQVVLNISSLPFELL
jgi:hypothetical protein